MKDAPIGMFDSGLGGLSVWLELKKHLPLESYLYIADSAHIPYGDKSDDFIRTRALHIGNFLNEQGAKAVVIACNTATAAAVNLLRESLDIPIIAMEPAVKPAATLSRTKRIGVLATAGTLESVQFAGLLERFASDVTVITQPCPGLPEAVERGDLGSPETLGLLRTFTTPLKEAQVDVVVLGCTHYPFLKNHIAKQMGSGVALIDTGEAVARRLKQVLTNRQRLASSQGRDLKMWSSGNPDVVTKRVTRLLGQDYKVELLPELTEGISEA